MDADGSGYGSALLFDLEAAGFVALSYRDATDDAPAPVLSPNVMVAELLIETAAYDWLWDNAAYGQGCVIWSETA